uniref:Uncharacterized protein n=1 Tax=Anguilla anguilla TaxID=7936 RepID=A0A0E9UCB4_ANGAN
MTQAQEPACEQVPKIHKTVFKIRFDMPLNITVSDNVFGFL